MESPVFRILPGIVVFVFYMDYVGLQFLAGGTIFESVFGVNTTIGLIIIRVLIIMYALAGGFLSVVWTDTIQALLMVFTLVVLPEILLVQVLMDPSLSIMGSLESSGDGRVSWLGGATGGAAFALLRANLSWFLACLGGYPHLTQQLMAVRSEEDRRTVIIVSTVWGVLTAIGTVLLGFLARSIHGVPEAIQANSGMVLPYMVLEYTPGLLGGILLAGALAAMMSTADSQLVVASSAVAHDIYNKVIKRGENFIEENVFRSPVSAR